MMGTKQSTPPVSEVSRDAVERRVREVYKVPNETFEDILTELKMRRENLTVAHLQQVRYFIIDSIGFGETAPSDRPRDAVITVSKRRNR